MRLVLNAGLLLALSAWGQGASDKETQRIRQLIASYVELVNGDNSKLTEVWENGLEVSFTHPLGEAHGIDEVRAFFVDLLGGMFTDRKLMPRDIRVHVYGDGAWSEFHWHFTAKQKKDGAAVESDGRETQVYHKVKGRWMLVHVHYSEMPQGR